MKDKSFGGRAPKKVLIVLHGAIGDVAHALPLAVRIKRAWPQTELSWAVEPLSKGLVEGHPAIDRVFVFDRPKGLSAFRRFVGELMNERFDLVLDLQRHFKSGLTTFLTRAPRRLGFHPRSAKEFNWIFNTDYISPVPNFSPKIEHYQLFGDALSLPRIEPLEFGLQATGEDLARMETLIAAAAGDEETAAAHRLGLIVGSSWRSRFWTVERYVRLIETARSSLGLVPILIGGPGEQEFGAQILSRVPNGSALNLIGRTTLADLVPLLSSIRVAVGSDSGPMHIAAAVGTPVISLWGSTSPKRSAPYGSEQYVLQSAIGCSPCYRRNCPGLNTMCMRAIPSEAVVAQLEAVLGAA